MIGNVILGRVIYFADQAPRNVAYKTKGKKCVIYASRLQHADCRRCHSPIITHTANTVFIWFVSEAELGL